MALDPALIKAENLLATSPDGLETATPKSVAKVGDNWQYNFDIDTKQFGKWPVTLNSDGFSVAKGTKLGEIDVALRTINLVYIPWNDLIPTDNFATKEGQTQALADLYQLIQGINESAAAANEIRFSTLELKVNSENGELTSQITALADTVAGKASTADLTEEIAKLAYTVGTKANKADLNPIRLKLNNFYIESTSPPSFDNLDWRFWHEIKLVGADWRSRLYYRSVAQNDAILLHETFMSSVEEISPGRFRAMIEGGISVDYSPSRSENSGMLVSFPVGFLSEVVGYYLDSSGGVLRRGAVANTISADLGAVNLSFSTTAPPEATHGQLIFTGPGLSPIKFNFLLTP